jgi:Na+-transporting NADH:ubiquinone oxidoreductase subunit B
MSQPGPTAPALHPPFLHLGWTPAQVTLTQAAALLPPLLAALLLRGPQVALALVAALVAALGWEIAFALIRRRPLTGHGLTTGMIVAVMVPVTVPLWQVALAVTMGVVLAEMVFGGRGFGFLSAAAASLALLVFSFPGIVLLGGEGWIIAATLPGAFLLFAVGLISGRVVLAAAVAALIAVSLQGGGLQPGAVAALNYGLVFLGADPVAAASTRPGRWIYGVLLGALVAAFSGPALGQNGLVFAALLASIFAPLIDYIVAMAMLEWQRRRARG